MGWIGALVFWVVCAVLVGALLMAFAVAGGGGGRRCLMCNGERKIWLPHSSSWSVCSWCGGTGRR